MADAVYVTLLILLGLLLFRRRGAPSPTRHRPPSASGRGTTRGDRLSFKASLARRLDRLAFWCRLLLGLAALAYIALLVYRLQS